MTVTEKQRKLILERDEHTSQIRHYSEKGGWQRGGYCRDKGLGCTDLHVHHLKTRRTMRGRPRDVVDESTNLITTFACEHNGVCKQRKLPGGNKYVDDDHFVIHPDMSYARRTYDGTPRSYAVAMEIRDEMVAEGEPYWNTDHDVEMAETARERTQTASASDWRYHQVKTK